MSTVLREGDLLFTFDDDWHVRKWDAEPAYLIVRDALEGTKAVDFAGHRLAEAWLIEVKDFRGYRIENRPRLADGALGREVAEKVRDTIEAAVRA